MKTPPVLFLFALLSALPLLLGCPECLADWHRYASATANVTIPAGAAASVTLVVSAPISASTDPIGIEIGTDDCMAGPYDLDVAILKSDGTPLQSIHPSRSFFALDAGAGDGSPTFAASCRTLSQQFSLPTTALICDTSRCRATLTVQLSSAGGLGPRVVGARLVSNLCSTVADTLRTDGAIDRWN